MTKKDRDLLERLHNDGVILTVDGNRLKYKAPVGAVTPELRAAMIERRPDLVYEYHERAGILIYDARMPKDKAEARAANTLRGGTV
jgi:TubC N-terminal docking domain